MATFIKNRRIVTALDKNVLKKLFVLWMIILFPVSFTAHGNQASPNRSIVFRNVALIEIQSGEGQTGMMIVISGGQI